MIYTDRVHLVADSEPELHGFAEGIGLKREWYQDHPRHPHYDVMGAMVHRAIQRGAQVVSPRIVLRKSKQLLKRREPGYQELLRREQLSLFENEEYGRPVSNFLKELEETPRKKVFKTPNWMPMLLGLVICPKCGMKVPMDNASCVRCDGYLKDSIIFHNPPKPPPKHVYRVQRTGKHRESQ